MANLSCGMLAIILVFRENSLEVAAPLLLAAAIFDLFDGFLARKLGVAGPMGKQLDSLADGVTFGIVPAILITILLYKICSLYAWSPTWALSGLILGIASVYRLAKFNIDERQSDRFRGLPTPANALFWISVVALYYSLPIDGELMALIDSGKVWEWQAIDEHYMANRPDWLNYLYSPGVLVGLILLMSFWMISDIPLLSLKFKHFGLKDNEMRYLLLALGAVVITGSIFSSVGAFLSVPIILLLYLLISIWDERRRKTHEIQG